MHLAILALHMLDDTVWGLDEAVAIDLSVGAEVVDKTDVLAFWCLNWADTAIVGIVNVTNLHGRTVP